MLLYEDTLVIRPEQTRTNIVLEIVSPRDFDRLVIDACYHPVRVTDPETVRRLTREGRLRYGLQREGDEDRPYELCPEISNMVTLSLDIAGRFCGSAHRHAARQRIEVSEENATPGFHRMRPVRGVWRITLPVHLVAGTDVTYSIRVQGLEGGTEA